MRGFVAKYTQGNFLPAEKTAITVGLLFFRFLVLSLADIFFDNRLSACICIHIYLKNLFFLQEYYKI